MRSALRDEDVVAHLSGDEFAVGLFDVRQHFEATTVAQKLQAALEAPFLIDGHDLRVGASIGISVYPQDGSDAETLLRMADIAMERAKEGATTPTDSVAFYRLDMNQGMQQRMRIESGLRHALGNGELLLHYQPKFAIDSGRIVGAEALVRWLHPAARHGAAGRLHPAGRNHRPDRAGGRVGAGSRPARRPRSGSAPACRRSAWRSTCRPASSRRRCRARGRHAGSATASTPAWLELEITESTLMHDIERVIAIMDRISALGVALSLDDFGTGYSSLSYLKRFPIDTLKIDRSFTTGIPTTPSDCAIASTIIGMGRKLGHRVIAEGVETVEQLEFLRAVRLRRSAGLSVREAAAGVRVRDGLRENWLLTGEEDAAAGGELPGAWEPTGVTIQAHRSERRHGRLQKTVPPQKP